MFNIVGLEGSYTIEDRHATALKYIRDTVGSKKVLMLASGGVDSTVCCALLNEALGSDNVIAIHIDTGFMRKNESEKVEKALSNIGLHMKVINAREVFYNGTTEVSEGIITKKLNETVNPEEKRKIIGDVFMHVAEKEIQKLGLDPENVILAQGTLRPDLIESGSKIVSSSADTIKTHHNDTNLVRKLREQGRVIEPLKDYHKDEVRALGKELGIPDHLIDRHPFPGPGLAVRIICAEQPYIDDSFNSTNSVLNHIVRGNEDEIEQNIQIYLKEHEIELLKEIRHTKKIFANLLPVKTVGVQGDCRSYHYLCSLTSTEKPKWEQLFVLAKLIPRVCHNINRVVFIFGKPIEEPITTISPILCTPQNITLLQEADDIVTQVLYESNETKNIAQAPVILFPIGNNGKKSIAMRTLITNDFMTGAAAIPGVELKEETILSIYEKIKNLENVEYFAYDLTSKPPATTEWE